MKFFKKLVFFLFIIGLIFTPLACSNNSDNDDKSSIENENTTGTGNQKPATDNPNNSTNPGGSNNETGSQTPPDDPTTPTNPGDSSGENGTQTPPTNPDDSSSNPTTPTPPGASSDDTTNKFEPTQNDNGSVLPLPYSSRTENLNFIFGTSEVAKITLYIDRSEWDNLLSYYDTNPKNEEYIHANFEMTKGAHTWKIENVGMRLRGNTSRIRPQQGNEYYQAHFKIDFEEWISDNDPERKLAGCMKGMNLKRFKEDPAYVREIFGYNYFRKNGIWTSPRAGYTRLFINIAEKDGKTTALDYGVYAMIEETKKQLLKEREGDGKLTNNKGNLWKCTYTNVQASLTSTDDLLFGVEDVKLDDSQSKRYTYDLKTNKEKLEAAKTEFKSFITELNALSDNDTAAIKTWFEKKMDINLFLKTYACNVVLGMDDDYWRNSNNYYLYFDTAKKGEKVYFLPYDYDNCLGTNCFEDPVTKNPLKWGDGNGGDAPLITKALKVPEFLEIYKDYLLELTGGNFVTDCKSEIQRLQALVSQYIKSNDITYQDTKDSIYDDVASWCTNRGKYKLLSGGQGTNYFETKAASIRQYCGSGQENTPPHLNGDNSNIDESTLILPYKYWTEGNTEYLEFTYNPADFKYEGEINYIVIASPLNGWQTDEPKMTKTPDGSYTYKYSGNVGEFSKMDATPCYKFVINGNNWIGYEAYNHKLPEKYAQYDGHNNFLLPNLK